MAKIFSAASLGTTARRPGRTSVRWRSGTSSATDTRYRLSIEIDFSPRSTSPMNLPAERRTIAQPILAEAALLSQLTHTLRQELPHVGDGAVTHVARSLTILGSTAPRGYRTSR